MIGEGLPVVAVVVAGGAGVRMGGGTPKQYRLLAGAPVLAWTLRAFDKATDVDEVVLVVPPSDLAFVGEAIVDAYRLTKIRRIVEGGATRQESTAAGVAAVEASDGVLLVHDGVRPFVSGEHIAAVVEAAWSTGAAILAVPVTDTVKRVDDRGCIEGTISRENLWAAQTPQGFRLSLFREAMARARREGFAATDEAMMVERMNHPVMIVPGDAENIKLTVPEDFARAAQIAERRSRPC